MNTLFLYDTKTMRGQINTNIFAGDNLITKINVQLPNNIGGYPKRECEYNLRAIIPEGNLSYMIDPLQPYFYITNDITEKAQTVKLMMIITHEGNVIGRTNTVDLIVNEPAEAPDPPLTPREEFDEVIAEQRAEIAEQAGTISEQASQIEQDTETISGLNTQVSELTTENEQLETQHTADQNTIQYLIENPPEAHLQPKSVTPTSQMQVVEPDEGYQGLSTVTVGAVTPPRLQSKQVAPSLNTAYVSADSGYDGLSSVTVDNVDASIDSDIQPENIKEGVEILGVEGTFNPFPYNSVGGIYITEIDEDGYPVKYLIKDWEQAPTTFPKFYTNSSAAISALQEIKFENCPSVTSVIDYFCQGLSSLRTCILPDSLTTLTRDTFNGSGLRTFTFPSNFEYAAQNTFFNCRSLTTVVCNSKLTGFSLQMFYGCSALKTINIPASINSIANMAFGGCSALENVTIEDGFNANNLNLSSSTLYSVETIVSWLEALADRTGLTAYTLTIGTTNINKLTAEQKAIATNKNWNLA